LTTMLAIRATLSLAPYQARALASSLDRLHRRRYDPDHLTLTGGA